MATKGSTPAKRNQSTVDKAGPTTPMSRGVVGKAPSDGVQSTAEAAQHIENEQPRTPNLDQG